ncbi:Butirosin biosynthesis, BtrG-like protein, partial [Hyaloraphidium curvatum]
LNKTAAPAAAEFPVFTYGSLRHDDVYRRAIGGQRWEDVGVPERVRGFVKGYARHPVKEAAYPAMIFTDDDRDIVDGALSYVPEAYLRLLDEFEGDDYGRFPVQVHLTTGKTVQATAWVWIAGAHWLDLSSAWSYDDFLKNKLAAWLAMSDEDFLVAGETRFQVQETVERESICDGQEDDLGFSTMDGITVMA